MLVSRSDIGFQEVFRLFTPLTFLLDDMPISVTFMNLQLGISVRGRNM